MERLTVMNEDNNANEKSKDVDKKNPRDQLPKHLRDKEIDILFERVGSLCDYGGVLLSQASELFRKGTSDGVAIGIRNSGNFLLKEYETLKKIANEILENES